MLIDKKIIAKAKLFLSDESGATAIEYALIAAGIVLTIVGTVQSLGSTTFKGNFTYLSNNIRK